MPRPNSRDPETDPAAYLGDELARARDAAGFKSQQALADHLGFERSVVGKAETGERVPTPDVLMAWCKACNLDYGHYSRGATLARRADGPIPRWFESWLAAEAQAQMLRYWQPVIIPGILQTERYARAILLAAQTDTSDENITALVTARTVRRAIIDRPDPPDVVVVLDELVLRRLVGSPEIMREQLTFVAELASRPNVCTQIVPASVGATAGLSGAVNLANGDGMPDVLHTDAVPEGHTTESRSQVRAAAVAFERVRGDALSRGQSRDLLVKVTEEIWNT